jgi:hypothetical protein
MPRRAANVFRAMARYVTRDLREIVWPRAMPDPPGTRYPTDLTLRQHLKVWREAAGMYVEGWRWFNGEPEKEREERLAALRAERGQAAEDETADEYRLDPEDTTTFKDELGSMVRAGARVGADGWRHRFRSFYETRGAAYMNAAKEFVAGYKEGVAEVAENRGGGEDRGGEEGAPPRTKTWEKQ